MLSLPGIDGESHNAPKIPTLINYNDQNFTWGASVNQIADNIVGVKLLLDPSQEKPFYLPTSNTKSDLKKLPKSAITVAADFIRAMYQHALQEISKQVPKSYMDLCQKQFVLSGEHVPSHVRIVIRNLNLTQCPPFGPMLPSTALNR